jgi:mevalonate kinase
MAKITTRNSELLKSAKAKTSTKVYSLLVKLVNEDREDLAEVVLKIDYLLEYASTCIKLRDFNEAKESLNKAKVRMDKLKEEEVNIEYIDYLYEGIAKKIKI